MVKINRIIPEGTRDFTIEECEKRRAIIEKVMNTFEKWGYREISTPTIEYLDNFNYQTKILKEEEMYKFFDNRGHILVLRPDMTVPVARMVSSKLKDLQPPIKLSYTANIFRVHEMLAGVENEYTDCGVELIGVKDKLCDLEILVTAIETLKLLTNNKFTVEIGNVNILKTAMEEMNLTDEEKEKIADLIEKKSLINLQKYVDSLNLEKDYKSFLINLPWNFGDKEVLKKAKEVAFNTKVLNSILYLEKIYNDLISLGYEQYISLDISMVPRFNYYTGIIFRGYIDGIYRNVLRGGRYDTLLKWFGRDMCAIGFSLGVNLLIDYEKAKEESFRDVCIEENNEVEGIKNVLKLIKEDNKVNVIYKEAKGEME